MAAMCVTIAKDKPKPKPQGVQIGDFVSRSNGRPVNHNRFQPLALDSTGFCEVPNNAEISGYNAAISDEFVKLNGFILSQT